MVKAFDIEEKIKETIKEYNLLSKSDKVLVALSGGKDSTTTLYFLKKLGYNVSGIYIHLCMGEWSARHRENMIKFCRELGVELTIVNFNEEVGHQICYIKDVLKKKKNLSGSTVCGIMKRYILNKYAKKLGATKIATGHNLDDEVQNVLMNYLKGNIMLGVNSMPMTGGDILQVPSQNKISLEILSHPLQDLVNKKLKSNGVGQHFVQRIKPLYFVPEERVRDFTKKMKFEISYEQCPCSYDTYRAHTREWMDVLSEAQKEKIVRNFLKIAPSLREKNVRSLKACSKCGEPTSGELCSACSLFVFLK